METKQNPQFELCGEIFSKEHFPHLYRMVKTSRENAERQLKSIADVAHEGSVVPAAQAFESDLTHG